ncbi:MAG: hypothetical protein NC299_04270 [Lachnospiraceae bacterium]|nr:hypothetical protein [Ruminococcus sp.]MCM1274563.1 hypothetical protein [Lachnospiraceae bacterium]
MNKQRLFIILLLLVLAVAAPFVISAFSDGETQSFPESGYSQSGDLNSAQSESSVQSESPPQSESSSESVPETPRLTFRNQKLLEQHYQKHGIEMGFSSAEEYEKAAAAVVSHPEALHKIEAEDGDDVYYVESTNEFVIVSTDGYLRTYFNPDRGIDYFNRQ